MVDWDALLARKYDLLAQNANADTTRANAGLVTANADANFTGVRAGLLPRQTDADIAEANARTNLTNVQAQQAPGLAKASEAASYGSASANTAQGLLYGAQTTAEGQNSGILSRILGGDTNVAKVLQALRGLGLTTGQ